MIRTLSHAVLALSLGSETLWAHTGGHVHLATLAQPLGGWLNVALLLAVGILLGYGPRRGAIARIAGIGLLGLTLFRELADAHDALDFSLILTGSVGLVAIGWFLVALSRAMASLRSQSET